MNGRCKLEIDLRDKEHMNKKQMERQTEILKQSEEIQDARIVNFGGKDHIHIDYKNDDIGVISKEGKSSRIPVGKKGR